MKTIRIGTRCSKLALAQTEIVISLMKNIKADLDIEIQEIHTTGDRLVDISLDEIGGKGLFVKDIEMHLLKGDIDVAVHSLKDMPAEIPDGLDLVAFVKRDDPRDMLFTGGNYTLYSLPKGARIGTSSLRRKYQLKSERPDIDIVNVRGNVTTRLDKVDKELDGVILAAAGIKRLGLKPGVPLEIDTVIPAPGQGVIAIETRDDDEYMQALFKGIDHGATRLCSETERTFLRALGADCNFPVAAHAFIVSGDIILHGMIGDIDRPYLMVRKTIRGRNTSLGRILAEKLLVELEKS